MKVYVITVGEYSDYHICGVALDKKEAERIQGLLTDEYYKPRIETYDTDEYKFADGIPYEVVIRNGEVIYVYNLLETLDRSTLIYSFKERKVEFWKKANTMRFYGSFPSKEAAIKVAKEKWTQKVLKSEGLI